MRTAFLTTGLILATSPLCWAAQVQSSPTTAPEEIPHELVTMPHRWQEAMDDFGVPGMAVVVVRGDDVIYRGAFGVRDPQKQLPVSDIPEPPSWSAQLEQPAELACEG